MSGDTLLAVAVPVTTITPRVTKAAYAMPNPSAVPGAGAFGSARVFREDKMVDKITGSCDYRYWECRVTWDYRKTSDGTDTTRR